MALAAVVADLGGTTTLKQHIESDLSLARAVEAGFPAASLSHVLNSLSDSALQQTDIYEVVGSARTLQRKRKAQTRLSRDESDRLARLVRIIDRARESLGSREKALRWMVKPNRALEGAQPLKLLGSDAGTLAVEQVLGRIEHGVPS